MNGQGTPLDEVSRASWPIAGPRSVGVHRRGTRESVSFKCLATRRAGIDRDAVGQYSPLAGVDALMPDEVTTTSESLAALGRQASVRSRRAVLVDDLEQVHVERGKKRAVCRDVLCCTVRLVREEEEAVCVWREEEERKRG